MTEFQKEVRRRSERSDEVALEAVARLHEVDGKIDILARNMLVSEGSPTLHRMLADLEQERARLALIKPLELPTAEILPHPPS